MSIASALSAAVSGLTVSGRHADVISSNLANALTPGYARRQLEVADLARLAGVGATGIVRVVNDAIVAERQTADSALAFADTRSNFFESIGRVIGTPEMASSLSARLADLDAGLISASAAPDNPILLQNTISQAVDLARALNTASGELQRLRTGADQEIVGAVSDVNRLLDNIQTLNSDILRHPASDGFNAALKDQRQALVDQLSTLIPVRQVPRDNGAVALFTPGGAILLDGSAVQLEFTGANLVTPHQTLENGLLSGLAINGIAVPPSGDKSPVDGGRLAALFSIRDDLAVDLQTQLDTLSRDLVERFQEPGLDGTLAAGDPGLLTDAGGPFDPVDETGLAERITVNAALDPAQGGEFWRLRDGLGAGSPGPEGNGSLIGRLAGALAAPRALTTGDLGPTARSFSGHLAVMTSRVSQDRLAGEQNLSFASSRQSELAALELAEGVDSDAELQRLLLVEQAYAANARMIQTLDEMMQTILRI